MKRRPIHGALLGALFVVACAEAAREDDRGTPANENSEAVTMEPTRPQGEDAPPHEEPSEAPGRGTPRPAESATAPPAAGPAAPEAQQRMSGRIAVTGSTPATFVMLQREEGPAVQLTGGLEAELRRLSGAVVAVEGTLAAGGLRGGSLAVRSYEVVSIDGQRPHVGILEATADGHRLLGADTLRLEGVPGYLAQRAGAKVWVVGPIRDDVLHIQSFGVIRP